MLAANNLPTPYFDGPEDADSILTILMESESPEHLLVIELLEQMILRQTNPNTQSKLHNFMSDYKTTNLRAQRLVATVSANQIQTMHIIKAKNNRMNTININNQIQHHN